MRASLPFIVPGTDEPASGEMVTLLCVENALADLELVKLIIDTLRPTWRLLAARDGHEGLRLARDRSPDLILLNLRLPGLSGDGVLAALRVEPATALIPVVVYGADTSRQTRERLQALGANSYLLKPFNVHSLADELSALSRVGQGGPGPPADG